MEFLVSNLLILLGALLLLTAIAAFVSPLESLGWWAGWDNPRTGPTQLLPSDTRAVRAVRPDALAYLVYLSGVGTMDPTTLTEKEADFLDLLQSRLPGAVICRDVFPYSVTNTPLLGGRPLAPFWRWWRGLVETTRVSTLLTVVTTRNLFQVAVSADSRYGPIYNFGIAREIVLSLVRHGYRLGDPRPVIVMGLSGGGQIAVGSVPSLTTILSAPVWVVSIGGVLTSDAGILAVRRVYHLSGSRDRIQHVGALLYPGRWPILSNSAWNRAQRAGRLTVIPTGPMKHMGHGDYMSRSATLPNGQRFVDRTVDTIVDIVNTLTHPAPTGARERT